MFWVETKLKKGIKPKILFSAFWTNEAGSIDLKRFVDLAVAWIKSIHGWIDRSGGGSIVLLVFDRSGMVRKFGWQHGSIDPRLDRSI